MDNATTLPYYWKNGKNYNGRQQADYLAAVIRMFEKQPWFGGLFWWKWDEQDEGRKFLTDDPSGDKGFTIWGKPAADVMKKWCERG